MRGCADKAVTAETPETFLTIRKLASVVRLGGWNPNYDSGVAHCPKLQLCIESTRHCLWSLRLARGHWRSPTLVTAAPGPGLVAEAGNCGRKSLNYWRWCGAGPRYAWNGTKNLDHANYSEPAHCSPPGPPRPARPPAAAPRWPMSGQEEVT